MSFNLMNIAQKLKKQKQFEYKYGQDLINGENLFFIKILLFASILKNQNFKNQGLCKGPFLYYVRAKGWVGGPENGSFPLLYVVKMSLRRWVGGSKKPQNTLR